MRDERRLNVALTRARHAMWIVGCESSLAASADWRALMRSARARGCWCELSAHTLAQLTPERLLEMVPTTLLDGGALKGGMPEWPTGRLCSLARSRLELQAGDTSEDTSESNQRKHKGKDWEKKRKERESFKIVWREYVDHLAAIQ